MVQLEYKEVKLAAKPEFIDLTSVPGKVLISRSVQEVKETQPKSTRSTGREKTVFVCEQAELSVAEFDTYRSEVTGGIVQQIADNVAYEEYMHKISSPVLYTNGHSYIPIHAQNVYGRLLHKGEFPCIVPDATRVRRGNVEMTEEELKDLILFLKLKEEEYTAEYQKTLPPTPEPEDMSEMSDNA